MVPYERAVEPSLRLFPPGPHPDQSAGRWSKVRTGLFFFTKWNLGFLRKIILERYGMAAAKRFARELRSFRLR